MPAAGSNAAHLPCPDLKFDICPELTGDGYRRAPDGVPRVTLRVRLPDPTVTADVAARSVRKVQAAIRESGADGVAAILQGRLVAGEVIAEAGLVAQPKSPPKVAA